MKPKETEALFGELSYKHVFSRRSSLLKGFDSAVLENLASASIGEMDFLVTWNLRHIYKRGTQEMIREVNTRLRIPVPQL